jgi:hypothetical protein
MIFTDVPDVIGSLYELPLVNTPEFPAIVINPPNPYARELAAPTVDRIGMIKQISLVKPRLCMLSLPS